MNGMVRRAPSLLGARLETALITIQASARPPEMLCRSHARLTDSGPISVLRKEPCRVGRALSTPQEIQISGLFGSSA